MKPKISKSLQRLLGHIVIFRHHHERRQGPECDLSNLSRGDFFIMIVKKLNLVNVHRLSTRTSPPVIHPDVNRDTDLRHPKPFQALDAEPFFHLFHDGRGTTRSERNAGRIVEVIILLSLLPENRHDRSKIVELGCPIVTYLVPETRCAETIEEDHLSLRDQHIERGENLRVKMIERQERK